MGLRSPVEAVIFDIGATLVTGPAQAPNKRIANLLGGVSAGEVGSIIMTRSFESAEEVCAALEERFGPIGSEARTGIEQLWRDQWDAPVEIDGATETVLGLRKRGLKIGLLSDIWSPYYAGVEKAIPRVIDAADAVVLSFRTGSRKPDHKNFLLAARLLGVEPENAVMVGDTYRHDLLPALETGMQAVWVLARPDREIGSILEVLNGEMPAPGVAVGCIREVISIRGLTPDKGALEQTEALHGN